MSVAMTIVGTDMKRTTPKPSTRRNAKRAAGTTHAAPFVEDDDEKLTPAEQKDVDPDLRILASWGLCAPPPPRRKTRRSRRAS